MADVTLNNLIINEMTQAQAEANLSQIGEHELIITTDKTLPAPTSSDSGKILSVNVSGEYYLKQPLQPLTLTQSGTALVSTETFTTHVRVMVEFESSGVHYGADFILHPYDSSVCIVNFYVANTLSTAYIDTDGTINIAVPSGMTATNITAHYIKLGA